MPKDADFDYLTSQGLDRRRINGALCAARNSTMLTLLGDPRGTYDAECRELTNPGLRRLMVTADLGPFVATGLGPAVAALSAVLSDLRRVAPEIHRTLGCAAMLCCRRVAASDISISNHSWGTAIDLTLGGQADPWQDPALWDPLHVLQQHFARHGFFWGAAFHAEEPMHFEACDQLVREWAAQGVIGACPHPAPDSLSLGDRGTEVEALQHGLNDFLAPAYIDVDGIFGTDTRAATIECQRRLGLPPDGLAHAGLFSALGLA